VVTAIPPSYIIRKDLWFVLGMVVGISFGLLTCLIRGIMADMR